MKIRRLETKERNLGDGNKYGDARKKSRTVVDGMLLNVGLPFR